MATIGNDIPILTLALRFSSAKRSSSAETSPAGTECLDILSPAPGESDVTIQVERLSSKDTKIAARLVWMAAGPSGNADAFGILPS